MSQDGSTKEEAVNNTAAVKFDQDKINFALFPIRAYIETCHAFTYGAQKYSEGNWKAGKGFRYSRLLSAGDHHRKAFQLGENLDRESGLHHLAHAICNDAMLLETFLTSTGTDDRIVGQIVNGSIPSFLNSYAPPMKGNK